MKREYGALALLLALALLALWNVRRTDFLIGQIDLSLERAERALEAGDTEAALAAVENGLAVWHGARRFTSVFLRHADLDGVAEAFHDLREALMEEGASGAAAGFARLRYRLGMADRMEHLSFGSVF